MKWERWRSWALMSGLLTALAVTGCKGNSGDDDDDDDGSSGPSCASICKEAERSPCPGSETSSTGTCADTCSKIETLIRSAGCTKEWSAYLECFDGVPDKCDATDTTCQGKSTDFSACLTVYCQDQAHVDECTAALSPDSSDS